MKNKIPLFILILLFSYFLLIFFSTESGYYEYLNNQTATFTEEKIKEFEKDISEGKNVNIKDYLDINTKDYTNNITNVGDKISIFVSKSINFIIKGSYKLLEGLGN